MLARATRGSPRRSRPEGRGRPRLLRPRLRDGAAREGAAHLHAARAEPGEHGRGRGGTAVLDGRRRPAVLERPRRGPPQRPLEGHDTHHQADAGGDAAELRAVRRVRAHQDWTSTRGTSTWSTRRSGGRTCRTRRTARAARRRATGSRWRAIVHGGDLGDRPR